MDELPPMKDHLRMALGTIQKDGVTIKKSPKTGRDDLFPGDRVIILHVDDYLWLVDANKKLSDK